MASRAREHHYDANLVFRSANRAHLNHLVLPTLIPHKKKSAWSGPKSL